MIHKQLLSSAVTYTYDIVSACIYDRVGLKKEWTLALMTKWALIAAIKIADKKIEKMIKDGEVTQDKVEAYMAKLINDSKFMEKEFTKEKND